MATVTGGDKLEAYLRKMASRVGRPATLKVGILAGASYPDGTPVAMVAAVNEFGRPSIGQPPRPAFRNTVAKKGGEWPDALASALKASDYDATTALNLMGEGVAGQIREEISTLTSPPIKPETARRKGSTKPLVEKGIELGSIDYEIVPGASA